MKWITALSVFGVMAMVLGAQPGSAVQEELKKFAGTWECLIYVKDGQAEEASQSKLWTWQQDLQGNFKLLKSGKVMEAGQQNAVDPAKPLKTINSVVTQGENKGKKLVGIYRFIGDTVEICWATQPAARPTEFISRPGSSHVFEVWRKAKTQPGDPVQAELKKFAGIWEGVTNVSDGQAEDPALTRQWTWQQDIKGNFKLLQNGTVTQSGRQNEVNPTKPLKTINSVVLQGNSKGQTLVGIYRFVGDTVEICWAIQPAPRPTEFVSRPGSGHIFEVWRKVTK